MQKINLSKILFVLTSIFIFAAPAFAGGGRDFYIQQARRRFYDEQQTARTLAMSGSSIATTSNSSSVTGNPAGLGFMSNAETSVTYNYSNFLGVEEGTDNSRIGEDLHGGNALLAVPLKPVEGESPLLGTLGFGWSGYTSSVDDTANTDSDGYVFQAAYAKAIDKFTSLGYRLSYFNDQLNNSSSSYGTNDSYKHTLGYQKKVDSSFTFGASAFYGQGSPQVKVDGDSDYLDSSSYGVDIGSAYIYGGTIVSTSIDYQEYNIDTNVQGADQNGRSYSAGIGFERTVKELFTFRLGYRYSRNEYFSANSDVLNGNASFNQASFGLGFKLGKGKIDYGSEYKWTENGDWIHSLTYSLPIDFCLEEA